MSFLTQNRVLVLNKCWQVINVVTPQVAFSQIAADAATALDLPDMVPTKWEQWIKLPVREQDDACGTPRGAVRIPRVIIAVNYAKVPKRRPKLTMRNLRTRYQDRCAITGRTLLPSEASKEHVIPVSKGGGSDWDNVVLAHKDVNSRRGNQDYAAAGLPRPKILPAPKEVPVSVTIENRFALPEWDMFLSR